MRRLLTFAQPSGMFEDLANRQFGEQPHSEHNPENDIMSQRSLARIDSSRDVECLLDMLGADNLLQSRQAIQDPPPFIDRKRTSSLMHASHSLHVRCCETITYRIGCCLRGWIS